MKVYNEGLFETKFNQIKHKVELYLDCSNGESDNDIFKYPINPNTVVNMEIEDTLSDWVVKGHLTFFYNPETAPSELNSYLGQVNNGNWINLPEPKPFYFFRNDGFDRLRVRIVPDLKDSISGGLRITDPVHWTMSHVFCVYDVEDIGLLPGAQNSASATIKALKIYFWDEWYQVMINNIMEYSTAKSNINQKKETGIAMREIIEKSLTYPSGFPLDSIDGAPTGQWENGTSKIFYTAPAQTNAYESLMYIYKHHISEKKSSNDAYDFSLLIKERGPSESDTGQLVLRPISEFFNKAGASSPGEFQIEHFYLQSYTTKDKVLKAPRAPKGDSSNDKVDFTSFKHSMITSYRFVDISPLMNTKEFTTRPVYSFDFKNRKFHIEFEKNSVETARKFIADEYIKNVYKNNRGDLEKLFLITLEKNKQKGSTRNLKPSFSLFGDEDDIEIRQSDGLQKLLYTGLFQNACVHFRTLGLTNREPGRFIAIDKTEGVDSGNFEDKFYGQWFVINVKHVFESELYYNDITAVKVHRFDESPIKFPGTF